MTETYTAALFGGTALIALGALWSHGLAVALSLLLNFGLHAAISVAIYPQLGAATPLFWLLQVPALLYGLGLIRPRLRGPVWRALVEWPASAFVGGTVLALPWALATLLGWRLPGLFLPFLVTGIGLLQSLRARREHVTLDLRAPHPAQEPARNNRALSRETGPPPPRDGGLRLVQLTDTHLGGFMSTERLAGICAWAVSARPDLILLTGDYLTFFSNHDPERFTHALAPLRGHPAVYACLGNHDYEALAVVKQSLAASGVRLLIDESAVVETRDGPVEIIGTAHRSPRNSSQLCALLSAPRAVVGGQRLPRIVLLHDPARFAGCPPGTVDLALSGHTHGGQVGLVSLGLDLTAVSAVGFIDHGLWSRGRDHLYTHRGQGHYSPSLRIGVPAEESVVTVHFARSTP